MFRRRSQSPPILIFAPPISTDSVVRDFRTTGFAKPAPVLTISDHARALAQHSGHSYRAKRDHTTEQLKREMGL